VKNRRELIEAELCLNEGGWGEIRGGKRLVNLIQVGEKQLRDLSARSQEPGRAQLDARQGERDLPPGRRAAPPGRLRIRGPAQRRHPNYLETLARLESELDGRRSSCEGGGGRSAAIHAVSDASPSWNAVVRTTCVATGLDGGHAVNALPRPRARA